MAEEAQNITHQAVDRTRLAFSRSLWMIEEIECSLQLVPDEAERHYSLALIYVMRGKFDDAIYSLEKAVHAQPEHPRALWLLGELQFKLGNYQAAVEVLELVVKHEPDNLTAITWLSLAYHCLNKKGKAITTQSILQSIAPDLVISRLGR
jgi:tetratricopeptide (TPR) repeat protein